jgi:hypothetical protein
MKKLTNVKLIYKFVKYILVFIGNISKLYNCYSNRHKKNVILIFNNQILFIY